MTKETGSLPESEISDLDLVSATLALIVNQAGGEITVSYRDANPFSQSRLELRLDPRTKTIIVREIFPQNEKIALN